MHTTDWCLSEGQGSEEIEMSKGGQLYGDRWKLDLWW